MDGDPEPLDEPVPPPARNEGPPPPPADPLPNGLALPPAPDDGPKPAARVFFAVDDSDALVRFEEPSPSTVTTKAITGLASGEHVVGIAFHHVEKVLYAIGSKSRLYTVDRTTGEATPVGPTFSVLLSGRAFGFGFDPALGIGRVHSDSDQNLRLDPKTGWVAGDDPTLAFMDTDVNAYQSPNLVATAYTKEAVLYAIDSTRNLLTTLPTPSSGQVETVGALGVDVDDAAGFDVSDDGKAYGAFHVAGTTGLYTVDLASGAATLAAPIGVTTALHGLAIEP